ncbi:MAG: hypothetical protein KDB53_12915, partial [Planctomycetes bacterium]|nr:hypothetical protein [Planctomycetota bacterium]
MEVARRLRWTRGYPQLNRDGAVVWRRMPAVGFVAESMTLDPRLIGEAELALDILPRRFPQVLEMVLGRDLAEWQESERRRLERLKEVMRGDRLPGVADLLASVRRVPAGLARDLVRVSEGGLSGLAGALVWLHWGELERLAPKVRWLVGELDRIPAVLAHVPSGRSIEFGMRLATFGPETPLWHTRLLAFLSDPLAWDTPLDCLNWGKVEMGRRIDGALTAGPDGECAATSLRPELEGPRGDLPREILEAYAQLDAVDRPARARLMGLIVGLRPHELVSKWSTWWGQTDQLLKNALDARYWRSTAPAYHREARRRLKVHLRSGSGLPRSNFSALIGSFRSDLLAADEGVARATLSLLDQGPLILGADVLKKWPHRGELAPYHDDLKRLLRSRHAENARDIATGTLDLLEPASPEGSSGDAPRDWKYVSDILGGLLTLNMTRPQDLRRQLPDLFIAIRRLVESPPLSGYGEDGADAVQILSALLRVGMDPQAAVSWLQDVEAKDWVFWDWHPEFLVLLRGDRSAFGRLDQLTDRVPYTLWPTLRRVLRSSSFGPTLIKFLRGKNHDLRPIIHFLRLVQGLGDRAATIVLDCPVEGAVDARRFPEPLRPMIRRLEGVNPGAASRLFGRHFPDVAAVQRQVDAIEGRILAEPQSDHA